MANIKYQSVDLSGGFLFYEVTSTPRMNTVFDPSYAALIFLGDEVEGW